MRYYKIANPGTVPVDALTLFGATTKDGISTIGQFGSGFIYALALSQRLGMEIQFTLGDGLPAWKLGTEARDIGSGQQSLEMVLRRGRHRLNMRAVTSLGQKDWTEPYQVLRELICNAQDAGNPTFGYVDRVVSVPGEVAVFITVNPQVIDCLNSLPQKIRFLPGSVYTTVAQVDSGELLDAPGLVFAKGVFIKGAKGATWGYDFTRLRLTESRSVDSWYLDCAIRDLVHDLLPGDLATWLKHVQAMPGCYEANLGQYNWNFRTDLLGEAWRLAFGENAVCDCYQAPSAQVDEACRVGGKRPVAFRNALGLALVNAGVPSVSSAIGDADRDLTWVDDTLAAPELREIVDTWWPIIRGRFGVSCPRVRYFNAQCPEVLGICMGKEIGVRWDHQPCENQVISTLVEEAIHHVSGAGDFTRDFQRVACDWIRRLLMEFRIEAPL